VGSAEPERPEGKPLDPVGGPESFNPDSSDYKAYGWADNRSLPSLRVWELIVGHRTPWIHELPTQAYFAREDKRLIHFIIFKPILAEDGMR
jgi:hypothetical protein